jgi:hypothetical protein
MGYSSVSRTVFTGGPNTRACRIYDGDVASCEMAWAISRNGAVNCFVDGSQCRGCGPRNDGDDCVNSCTGPDGVGITVEADLVTLDRLRIRNGLTKGVWVEEDADGTHMKNLHISGPNSDCIVVHGDDTTIEDSTIRVCGGDGVATNIMTDSYGPVVDQLTISNVHFNQIDGECIDVLVTNFTAEDNRLENCWHDCIEADGVGITIQNNVATNCDGEGIEAGGGEIRVEYNRVSTGTSDAGIEVGCGAASCDDDPTRTFFAGYPGSQGCREFNNEMECEEAWLVGRTGAASCFWADDHCRGCGLNNELQDICTNTCTDASVCTVRGNFSADSTDDECFLIEGWGILVEDNEARDCNEEGFRFEGFDFMVWHNEAHNAGSSDTSDAFAIRGSGHTVEHNTATESGRDGFGVAGFDHTLTDNVARDSGEDGFDVGRADTNPTENITVGVTLNSNTATGSNSMGIEVSAHAEDTIVDDNEAKGNRVDYCDEGMGTSASGNDFETTDPVFCRVDTGTRN